MVTRMVWTESSWAFIVLVTVGSGTQAVVENRKTKGLRTQLQWQWEAYRDFIEALIEVVLWETGYSRNRSSIRYRHSRHDIWGCLSCPCIQPSLLLSTLCAGSVAVRVPCLPTILPPPLPPSPQCLHTTLDLKWGGGLYSNIRLVSTVRPTNVAVVKSHDGGTAVMYHESFRNSAGASYWRMVVR